jgi:hypothetical protein
MILSSILFSLLAAAAVWAAGRRDEARDPKLTLLVLGLLAIFPLLLLLPKLEILPAGHPGEATELPWWWPWLWGSGVFLAGLRLTVALVQLCLWRARSTPAEASGGIPVRILPGLSGPIAAGILYPVIFVPPAWAEWSREVRHAVIAHETKHHQRRDPLWRAIGAAACTIHWYNPVVWWMARRLADQCEYACDEAVLADGMQADRYAHVLCDLAAGPRSPATALAMAHRSGLESRVRRMFSAPPQYPKATVAALGVFTLITALGLVILKPAPPPSKSSVPIEEVRLRLSADPFPGNSP